MRNNNTKLVAIIALSIAVIGLSIGFAAFSSTLNISSRADVNPVNTFSVLFASQASTSDNNVSYSVPPAVPVSISTTGNATSDSPTINNTGNPTISNLNATFTAPGDRVTYTFYVVNAGNYDAYLTNLIFNNSNGSFKSCVATGDNPVSSQLLNGENGICSNITFNIVIGNELAKSSTTTLSNHLLSKKTFETVTVTIAYTGSTQADGAFIVNFGDIELEYRTVDEPIVVATSEENPWPIRGLRSSNVIYNQTYEIQTESEYMAPEFEINDDGGMLMGKEYLSDEVDDMIEAGTLVASSDNIIIDMGSVYVGIEFDSGYTANVYLAQNTDFDLESIKEGAFDTGTFEVEVEDSRDDLIPTQAQLASADVSGSGEDYSFASGLPGSNHILTNIWVSITENDLASVQIMVNNATSDNVTLYVWFCNNATAAYYGNQKQTTFSAKTWYTTQDSETFSEYNSSSPVSTSDFAEIKNIEYVTRVINSFSS